MAVIYFDTSALGQLTDPPAATNVVAQAAVRQVVRAIATERFRLISSAILVREALRVREDLRQIRLAVLDLAFASVLLEPTEAQAQRLLPLGFRRADALHISAAYTGHADYLLTYDDHFLRRSQAVGRILGPGPAIVRAEECLHREGLG